MTDQELIEIAKSFNFLNRAGRHNDAKRLRNGDVPRGSAPLIIAATHAIKAAFELGRKLSASE